MSTGQFARQADSFQDEALRGQWFSTGRTLVVPAGDSMRATITNPLGSGKLLVLHRLRTFVTTPSEYVTLFVNPTTNLPAFLVASPNRRLGMPGSVSVVRMDVGPAMSGGSVLPYAVPIEVNSSTLTDIVVDPGIGVPPGVSFGINFTNGSGGPDANTIFVGDFKEVPL